MSISAVVHGMGHALPVKIVTNADLEKKVETNDAWIVQRTGIQERRVCNEAEECTGYLALAAAREAVDRSGIDPKEIELVVCATVSGDYIWPATACFVQDALGIPPVGAFDVSAACAGYIYAMANATSMIRCGDIGTALVIGVDCLSRQLDWNDRSTCILFGDAAAATVLRGEENTDRGVLQTVLMSDGSGGRHIGIEVGGSRFPYGREWSAGKSSCITMNGQEVYRFAIEAMGDACHKVLEKAGMTPADVDLFVPHQANLRIIDSAAKRLSRPPEKVFINVQKYGNTSGGSVPLALYEAEQEGRLEKGMVVMTVGFGAGLVWGANLIRW